MTAKDPAGIKNSTGWATGLGAVRQNDLGAHISYTTLCFSRPATVGNASNAGSLDPAGELHTASCNITLLASPGTRSVMYCCNSFIHSRPLRPSTAALHTNISGLPSVL